MVEKSIKMEVVTPERVVFSEEVDSLIVPAAEGYLGVLPNHAPLITGLEIGVVRYKQGGRESKMAISGGFMEVYENRAIILADTAEKGDEIDLERAQRAKERAEKRLKERPPDLDVVRAELALKRALARIKAAQ
ncbi:F0F1 ATP synthase subunit epsilon [Calderihabitans maritimus]|uniref:ATP synthase epsilon chain n=1 Tax=Calderihabitans maritimus TaxID=1246530 RepID=A0A1Z5HX30_9FIRM|nr:F0F1 ATP synthase subunit epsilon [Calderihabitans maritimus]GAW93840.1 ATP synthase F1 subunit epsilon [Calderihabitans maritimus]